MGGWVGGWLGDWMCGCAAGCVADWLGGWLDGLVYLVPEHEIVYKGVDNSRNYKLLS